MTVWCHFRTSGSTLDALWTLLIDFLPAERNAMFDWIPSHLETWAQTGEVPVVEHQIRYDDGTGYERYMGRWSRLAGEVFLDWLAPRPGLRWIDIGCGNGAFTELLVQRCAPAEVQGIDPSEAQLAFARARPTAGGAAFHQGDAMALPFPQDRFDTAVMALVIFFVPDPAKGVAEMVRVVCPAARSPPMRGICWAADFRWNRSRPKCAQWALSPCSRPARAHHGWMPCGACGRGQASKRSRRGRSRYSGRSPISTQLPGRPACWPRASTMVAAMASGDVDRLKTRVHLSACRRRRGRITYSARANATKGRVPQRNHAT